jgi:hypothetical protein
VIRPISYGSTCTSHPALRHGPCLAESLLRRLPALPPPVRYFVCWHRTGGQRTRLPAFSLNREPAATSSQAASGPRGSWGLRHTADRLDEVNREHEKCQRAQDGGDEVDLLIVDALPPVAEDR